MRDLKDDYLKQLDEVINLYETNRSTQAYVIMPKPKASHIITSAVAAIERIAGSSSAYGRQIQAGFNLRTIDETAEYLVGVVYSLRHDVADDFLIDLREIVHGEVYTDFLDMADFLLKEGFKDPAAVMAGGVLESHLRQLCTKHGIETEVITATDTKPKKADQMNADLAKNKVYNLLEQKNITAWLDLRNRAAHAKYSEYLSDHVSVMLTGLRSFISRYPA